MVDVRLCTVNVELAYGQRVAVKPLHCQLCKRSPWFGHQVSLEPPLTQALCVALVRLFAALTGSGAGSDWFGSVTTNGKLCLPAVGFLNLFIGWFQTEFP